MPKLLEKRVTDAMIVQMARLAFEDDRTQAEIGRIMGMSPTYVWKHLDDGARRNLFIVSRRKVTSNIDGQIDGAMTVLDSPSQLAVVVNGTRVVAAVDMASAEPQTTRMELCGRTITITVSASDNPGPT